MDFAPLDGTISSWSIPKRDRRGSLSRGSSTKPDSFSKGPARRRKSFTSTRVDVEESKSILFSYYRSDDEDMVRTSGTSSGLAWDMGSFLDVEPPAPQVQSRFAFVESSTGFFHDEHSNPGLVSHKPIHERTKPKGSKTGQVDLWQLNPSGAVLDGTQPSPIQDELNVDEAAAKQEAASDLEVQGPNSEIPERKSKSKVSKEDKKKKKKKKGKTAKTKKKKKQKTSSPKSKSKRVDTSLDDPSANAEHNMPLTSVQESACLASLSGDVLGAATSIAANSTVGEASYIGMLSTTSGSTARLSHEEYIQQLMNLKAADVASTSTRSHQVRLPESRVESDDKPAVKDNGAVEGRKDQYIENIMTGKVVPKRGRNQSEDGSLNGESVGSGSREDHSHKSWGTKVSKATQSSSDPAVSGRPAKLFQGHKHAYENVQGLMITSGALESMAKEPLEGSVYLAGFKNMAIHENSNHQITGSPQSALATPVSELMDATKEQNFKGGGSKSERINHDARVSSSPKVTNQKGTGVAPNLEDLVVMGEFIQRLQIDRGSEQVIQPKQSFLGKTVTREPRVEQRQRLWRFGKR